MDDILPGDANDAWTTLEPHAAGDGEQATSGSIALQDEVDDLRLRLLESQTAQVAKLGQLRAQLAVRDDALRALQSELNASRDQVSALESRALSASLTADAELSTLRDEVRRLKADAATNAAPNPQAHIRFSSMSSGDAGGRPAPPGGASPMDAQLRAALQERDAARAELASRDSELRGIEEHVAEQQSRIRALHEQLATFITREASDGARVEDAVARAAEAETELAKRKQ